MKYIILSLIFITVLLIPANSGTGSLIEWDSIFFTSKDKSTTDPYSIPSTYTFAITEGYHFKDLTNYEKNLSSVSISYSDKVITYIYTIIYIKNQEYIESENIESKEGVLIEE